MRPTFSVFINCPFDKKYLPLFRAIVFGVSDCGLKPRCALEIEDSSQVRIQKIVTMISDCRFAIHDISRTSLDAKTNLPRFNMPYELGLFIGAKEFGGGRHRSKISLVLDEQPYRYQKFLSDIAGQDIRAHRNSPTETIRAIRNWLQSALGERRNIPIPSSKSIAERYATFIAELPELCGELKIDRSDLTYADYIFLVNRWLEANSST